MPGLRRIPGIRGLMDIPIIDFPADDERRLTDALAPENATFIAPNHPEFFTDWMLDKEILSRVAPLAACWATHTVVNGMGPWAQKFWLKNNLVAQIPGAAGDLGKAYSIDYALSGKGVLLHPEGNVGWHSDTIGDLYPGVVDMALEAAQRIDKDRKVFITPIVWKLKFNEDVSDALHREFNKVHRILDLPAPADNTNLAQRLYNLYDALLARDEQNYGIELSHTPYFERQERLLTHITSALKERLTDLGANAIKPSNDSKEATRLAQARRGERWLRATDRKSDTAQNIRKLTNDLRRIMRFHSGIYQHNHLTQEHIAESLKRIRNDYCTKTTRDTIHKYLPQPVGPRTAHIRVPTPLDVSELRKTAPATQILKELRERMQATLDEINREHTAQETFVEPNPFATNYVG